MSRPFRPWWALLTTVPVGIVINDYVVSVKRVGYPTHVEELKRGDLVLVVKKLPMRLSPAKRGDIVVYR